MAKLSPEEAQAKVRAVFGNEVHVKSIRPPVDKNSDSELVDIITKICYFYPQYNLETAQKLTDSQATALILQAEKQRAIDLYNYTLITASPHSKKGQLVNKLLKQYKGIIEA